MNDLGRMIAVARAKNGLSIHDLAKKTNLSPTTIFDAEKGNKKPQARTLWKICNALGIDMEEALESFL